MDFSKCNERPRASSWTSNQYNERYIMDTSCFGSRKNLCRLQKQQSKICTFLTSVGMLLVIMGCIVQVEKSRISSAHAKKRSNDSYYLQITANVLFVLGVLFVTFAVTLALYYFFKFWKISPETDSERCSNNRDRRVFSDDSGYSVSQNCFTSSAMNSQQHVCSVYSISETVGDPPMYCDLTTDDYPPPPEYDEANMDSADAAEQRTMEEQR